MLPAATFSASTFPTPNRSAPAWPPGRTWASAAERAKALADPSRLRVALALATGGEMCVCDLAWVCDFAQNLVSPTYAPCATPTWPPPAATANS
jgi:hypothetical protein